MLEEQLASSRRRAEQVLDLENDILQLKQTINQITIVSCTVVWGWWCTGLVYSTSSS